jgi:WD40 repeat protein
MILMGHEKAVTAVQVAQRTLYTPTTVYTGSADATVRIWDSEVGGQGRLEVACH